MKKRVQLAQVNYRYGRNVFLPYSVGLLQAYCLFQPDIAEAYEFSDLLYLRTPVDEVVGNLQRPDVFGVSCYIWNWEYSKALAAAVKKKWPACLIVLGGTHIPHNSKGFAAAHPWADILIYFEGEQVFANVLREFAKETPVFETVCGTVVCKDGKEFTAPPAPRIEKLDELPSPYLTGVFAPLINAHGIEFQASQETHRGCPYTCTFCDWGSATMSKVRQFPQERIVQEYNWFGTHGIDLLYNCDANYGLFERDLELTRALIKAKEELGKPTKFRAAYAKNSNDRVYRISSMLNDHKMCKGVTLSFQSIDPHTLELVERKNMKVNNFKELITLYRRENIPTYTELILGLPGETYDSFCDGICTMLEAGQHDSLNIYHAMLLPNSEMNAPEYRKKHGIRGVKTPLLLLHGTKEANDITEYYDVVVETSTMSVDDWVKASLFAYVVQAFHCLNLTQAIAVGLRYHYGTPYRKFYEGLIKYALSQSCSWRVREVFERIIKTLHKVAEGSGTLDLEAGESGRAFGDVMWPVEEFLFLKLLCDSSGCWVRWFHDYIRSIADEDDLVVDLEVYQLLSTRAPGHDGGLQEDRHPFKVDWHTFITRHLNGESCCLKLANPGTVFSYPEEPREWEDFAREVVWYGRKGGSLRRNLTFS